MLLLIRAVFYAPMKEFARFKNLSHIALETRLK
jgi:hypothetical protein